MANRIHDIGIARQIGTYSDAVEAPANARWLITAGTPGLGRWRASDPPTAGRSAAGWRTPDR